MFNSQTMSPTERRRYACQQQHSYHRLKSTVSDVWWRWKQQGHTLHQWLALPPDFQTYPYECYAVCCSMTFRRLVQNIPWSSGIYWAATGIPCAGLVGWQSPSLNCSLFIQLNQILNKFYTSSFLLWTTIAVIWIVTPCSLVIIYRRFRET